MRLLDRHDTSLAIALVAGALVVFQRPLHLVIDLARDVEVRYNVDLLPGLAVLVGAFTFHQYQKRLQSRAAATATASEIVAERRRSAELERLVAFGRALGAAIDPVAVQQLFWRYLPAFAKDREIWMLTRKGAGWDPALRDVTVRSQRSMQALEGVAACALSVPVEDGVLASGVIVDDDMCFPMVVGDLTLGVVGVRGVPELSQAERRALAAAVGLLAVAIRNVQLLAQTREQSVRDQLTGCFNRAYAVEALATELQRARRTGRPLSVMMFDVDRLKRINDGHGHLAGDAVLAALGRQLNVTLRSSDVKCRWGGDEFLVILPDTPLAGAEQACASLTSEVAQLRVTTQAGSVSPTISLGVAVGEISEFDPLTLIARADAALYRAKHAGRNRFVVANAIRAAV